MDINKVILVGRLTADPELNDRGSFKVLNFAIAVNGYKKEDVSFINCTAWDKTAELIAQYCQKGMQVAIEGRLKQERWTDESGKMQNKLNVVCESIQFLGGKRE